MSLNNEQMLPSRVRNMRQMNDLLNAEDVILAEIEKIIDGIYKRAELLHETLVNEAWLEYHLKEMSGANAYVAKAVNQLLMNIDFDIGDGDIHMSGVRKFIDTWLPAHLAYKLRLLMQNEVISGESFELTKVLFAVTSLFWDVRTLDGTWLLDDAYLLDAFRKQDKFGVLYKLGITRGNESYTLDTVISMINDIQELYNYKKMIIKTRLPFFRLRVLDGTWHLDGLYGLDAVRGNEDIFELVMPLGNAYILADQDFGVVIVRDLWFLDGRQDLDGVRILDAMKKEEVL